VARDRSSASSTVRSVVGVDAFEERAGGRRPILGRETEDTQQLVGRHELVLDEVPVERAHPADAFALGQPAVGAVQDRLCRGSIRGGSQRHRRELPGGRRRVGRDEEQGALAVGPAHLDDRIVGEPADEQVVTRHEPTTTGPTPPA
jgi:predicted oxidoreductase